MNLPSPTIYRVSTRINLFPLRHIDFTKIIHFSRYILFRTKSITRTHTKKKDNFYLWMNIERKRKGGGRRRRRIGYWRLSRYFSSRVDPFILTLDITVFRGANRGQSVWRGIEWRYIEILFRRDSTNIDARELKFAWTVKLAKYFCS